MRAASLWFAAVCAGFVPLPVSAQEAERSLLSLTLADWDLGRFRLAGTEALTIRSGGLWPEGGGGRIAGGAPAGRLDFLGDYRPFSGSFRITGGMASPSPWSGETAGPAAPRAQPRPYFGIGWSGRVGERLSLGVDVGGLYLSEPDISPQPGLSAAGTELERELSALEDLPFSPIVTLAVTYRF